MARLALSVARRHLATDPRKLLSVALRAAPTPVAGSVGRILPAQSPLRALALDAAGQNARARETVERLATESPADGLPAVLRVAAILHLPTARRIAVERLDDHPAARTARALSLVDAGERGAAVELLAGLTERGAASLRERVLGELAALRARPWEEERPAPTVLAATPRSVLHVVTNSLPWTQAGYTLRTRGLTVAQSRLGWSPQVVTRPGFPVDSGALPRRAEHPVDGVPHHLLLPPSLPLRDDELLALHVEELTRLVQRLRPAVLHAHSRFTNAQAALTVGRRLGIPVVYEVRGFLEETWVSRGGDPGAEHRHLARTAETACMAAADAVTTLSETMRQEIIGRGVDPARVHLLGNAAPREEITAGRAPATLERARAHREALGIGPDEVVAGTVTTLNDYEGTALLVDAFAAHCRNRPEAPGHLVVVGGGPALSPLQAQRAGLPAGVAERIHLVGRVPHAEVPGWNAVLDLFCVPRLDTPVTRLVTPLKPLSAMFARSVVLVADLPPLAELVAGGRGATVAPDPAAWTRALDEWMLPDATTRARREATAAAGARWAEEEATWEVVAARSVELYASLTGG